jgi:hypothetical protein
VVASCCVPHWGGGALISLGSKPQAMATTIALSSWDCQWLPSSSCWSVHPIRLDLFLMVWVGVMLPILWNPFRVPGKDRLVQFGQNNKVGIWFCVLWKVIDFKWKRGICCILENAYNMSCFRFNGRRMIHDVVVKASICFRGCRIFGKVPKKTLEASPT